MRADYDANRGPLDRPEYVRRKPDGFSVLAGCIWIVVMVVAVLAAGAAIIALAVHG